MKYKTVFMQMNAEFLPNIERKLVGMASKGWMLDEIKVYTMIFKKTVPQKVEFNILINPRNEFEEIKYGPVGEVEELCVEDGWEFILRQSLYVVFMNRKKSPHPIHTDPQILTEQIKGRIKHFVFIYAVIMIILLVAIIPIYSHFEIWQYYDPTSATALLIAIMFILEACLNLLPSLLWLGFAKNKNTAKVFEFPDIIFKALSSLRFMNSFFFYFVIFSLTLLQPLADIRGMYFWFGIAFLLFSIILSIGKREGHYAFKLSWEHIIRSAIVLFLCFSVSTGAIGYFARDTFNIKRAVRLSDFGTFNILEHTYSSPSIGLFAIKMVDYYESVAQNSVKTVIIDFYSKQKLNEYWKRYMEELKLVDKLGLDWGVEGYYVYDKSKVVFISGLEIIEVDSTVDLSVPKNINIVKNRVGLIRK